MAFGYPVNLELAGKRAVVIGDEAVRAGKVDGLLEVGADVTVIAQGPAAALRQLEDGGRATVFRRRYEGGDLVGAYLCIASSSSLDERAAIHKEGQSWNVLVNVMDDVVHCNWAAPALVRRGDLVFAISTGGKSPALARRLREDLEGQYGPEWAKALDVLEEVRHETLAALPDLTDRARRWQDALDTEELISLISKDQAAEAADRLKDRLLAAPPE